MKPLVNGEDYHGEYGFAGYWDDHTPAMDNPVTKPAAAALIELSHKHEDLRVMVLGPMTNIALAMTLDASFVSRVQRWY